MCESGAGRNEDTSNGAGVCQSVSLGVQTVGTVQYSTVLYCIEIIHHQRDLRPCHEDETLRLETRVTRSRVPSNET